MDLLKRGPIYVSIDGENNELKNFKPRKGEAYSTKICNRANHAVLLVGVIKEGNKTYILIRNSWEEGWGENGYF
jgi:C1A family cysteine protease